MEKERIISAPKWCEIKKVEIIDGVAVVTFKPQDRKLPKSWDEFCEMFPVQIGECYIDDLSDIRQSGIPGCARRIERDENIIPDRATAEAVLALCQLIQLRNAYNGDWKPDWTAPEAKFMIYFNDKGNLCSTSCSSLADLLFFKNEKLCEEFLRNFSDLIEKLKPLYGIMKGIEK